MDGKEKFVVSSTCDLVDRDVTITTEVKENWMTVKDLHSSKRLKDTRTSVQIKNYTPRDTR